LKKTLIQGSSTCRDLRLPPYSRGTLENGMRKE